MIDKKFLDDYAAEYVLGTLDRVERMEVDALRKSNGELDGSIEIWEKRLGSLNLTTPDATPSLGLFDKIDKRIFETQPNRPQQNAKYRSWKVFAMAASLAFLIFAGVMGVEYVKATSTPELAAVLQSETAKPMFVVGLNQKKATLDVHTEMALAPSDKSYELWLIPEGEKAPRPVGILSKGDTHLPITAAGLDPALIAHGTLAVSIEPLGGSPTGAPTGPVIVTGKFTESAL